MHARRVLCAYPRRESPCEKFLEYHPLPWVDCSRPAYKRRRLDRFFEYHPRQWVDCSSLAYEGSRPPPSVLFTSSPRAARGGRKGKTGIPGAPLCRLYLNNPPTAVGGISEFLRRALTGGFAQELDAHPLRSFGWRSHCTQSRVLLGESTSTATAPPASRCFRRHRRRQLSIWRSRGFVAW